MRVGEQFEPAADVGGSFGEVFLDGAELLLDVGLLFLELADLDGSAVGGEATFGDEIDQVVRLHRQLLQLCGELGAEKMLGALLVFEGVVDCVADPADELGLELHRAVVTQDGLLNFVGRQVARLAGVISSSDAEEVEVLGLIACDGALDDETAVVHPPLEVALSAPDGALEVVVVDAFAFASLRSGVEELLDTVEQVAVDDGRMPANERVSLVDDVADVVGVAEEPRHLGGGDGASGTGDGGPGGEATEAEFLDDFVHRVFAAAVELEGEGDEWCSVGVDGDRVDLAAFDHLGDVEVADGCLAEGAAALGLLTHLVRDVGTIFAGAVLVEGGEDAVHELPDRGVVDLLGRGDEGDVSLLELGHHDGVVDSVAGEPGELVDNDEVHVLVAADTFEHALELDALGHLGSGASRLDVLVDHGQAELVSFAAAGDALGGD